MRRVVALVVAAGAVVALAGCDGGGGGGADAAKPKPKATVGHDTALVRKLFPYFGEVTETTWATKVLGTNTRQDVPGPTDQEFTGVAKLGGSSMAALVALKSDWANAQITCAVPEELKAETGDLAGWLRSEQFDRSVAKGHYTGSFYLDVPHGRVFFCTMNPREPAA
ncbi:hypothetical protein [Kitasatospora sp. NPDC101183]|uniref:hypothetical protein n=1 Tax=Kitasatospora sp. NPDC101183 TaxID=3364100 RepID=UPI00380A75FD